MSVDIQQTQITIPPIFQGVSPFLDDHQSILSLTHAPSFDNSFLDDPSFLQALPCSKCSVQVELSKLCSESAYWRTMHHKAVERETLLKKEVTVHEQ